MHELYYTLTFLLGANVDYLPVNALYTVSDRFPKLYEYITIKDNPDHDGNRKFLFLVQGTYGVSVWVEICIWDDEWGMLSFVFACIQFDAW